MAGMSDLDMQGPPTVCGWGACPSGARTAKQWLKLGRIVRPGSRAAAYVRLPGGPWGDRPRLLTVYRQSDTDGGAPVRRGSRGHYGVCKNG